MKKKGIAILLCTALLITGCANKKDDLTVKKDGVEGQTTADDVENAKNQLGGNTDTDSSADESDDLLLNEVVDYNEYITLGEYKNFNLSLEVEEVTEDDVTEWITYELENTAKDSEVTDRAAILGDTVNIDFEGYVDEVQFDGGTATDYSLVLGSNSFIPGFEDQLVGSKTGDVVNVNTSFPEDYGKEELNGKDVLFVVTINGIYESVVPELNDEWVTNNTTYANVDEYKKGVKADLEAEALTTAKDNLTYDILDKIVSNSTIIGYPETEVNNYATYLQEYYAYYASMLGMDAATFFEVYMGKTEEEFAEESIVMAQDTIVRQMICQLIAEKEELPIPEELYTEYVTDYATNYGYESVEAFENDYGKEMIENNIRMELALEFVYDNNVTE